MEHPIEYTPKELDCNGCMGPCGFCETEEDDDIDLFDCCIQIGWPHGDFCPCKEQANYQYSMLPFYLRWWYNLKHKVLAFKYYWFAIFTCEECGAKTLDRKVKACQCPKCGNYNLPF